MIQTDRIDDYKAAKMGTDKTHNEVRIVAKLARPDVPDKASGSITVFHLM